MKKWIFLGLALFVSLNLILQIVISKQIANEAAAKIEKESDVISVRDFGAVGDGSTDDTAAIRKAVAYTTSNQMTLTFETGKTYLIKDTIFIGSGQRVNWTLNGNRAIIKQATDNMPIFHLKVGGTPDMIDRFTIENFNFTWSNNQKETHTKSYAVAFSATTDNAWGISNFTIENIHLNNGYVGFGIIDPTKFCPLWGGTFRKIQTAFDWKGRVIDIWMEKSMGNVNLKLEEFHLRGDNIMSDNLIRIKEGNSLTIDNIEVIHINPRIKSVLLLQSCADVKIGRIRIEEGDFNNDWEALINFSQVFNGIIEHIEIQGINFSPKEVCSIFKESHNDLRTLTEIKNISIYPCEIKSGSLYLIASHSRVKVTGNIFSSNVPFKYAYLQSMKDNLIEFLLQDSSHITEHKDEDVKLEAGQNIIHMFNQDLTANRTITLPEKAYNGLKFRIVRKGLGNYTLAVGSVKTLPANRESWIEVVYDNGWKVIGYGTF